MEVTEGSTSCVGALRYTAGTDIGLRRDENQDAFGVIEGADFRIYLVADGMGGVRGGAIASSLAISTLRHLLPPSRTPTPEGLVAAIEEANREIFRAGVRDPAIAGMGTTLVALAFLGRDLYVANVGDSRVYRISDSKVQPLSRDHTLVMELLRAGTITEEQVEGHPVAHMLTRSLGPSEDVEVDLFKIEPGPRSGDRFLLCSDGLYNMVSNNEILQIVNEGNLDDSIQRLINTANAQGGTDNITMILVEVGKFDDTSSSNLGETSAQTNSKLTEGAHKPRNLKASIEVEEGDDKPVFSGSLNRRWLTIGAISGFLIGGLSVTALMLSTQAPRNNAALRISGADERLGQVVGIEEKLPELAGRVDPPQVVARTDFGKDRSHATSGMEIQNLQKRRDSVVNDLADLAERLRLAASTDRKEIEAARNEMRRLRSEASDTLNRVRDEMDAATRRLAVWHGRRARIVEGDPTVIASEVAVSSDLVRRAKEDFEKASWDYLKEVEESRYNPDDKIRSQNVQDLMRVRTQRMNELLIAVRQVIDSSIAEADASITDLALRRENLQSTVRHLDERGALLDSLMIGDKEGVTLQIGILEREREALQGELEDLNSLLNKVDTSVVKIPPSAANSSQR